MRATALPDVLSDAGLTVNVMAGFASRGRDLHDISGLVWHHSASSPAWAISDLLRLLRDGRADLSGPLYQAGVDRVGTWHLIAAGRANHAGSGRWLGLDGNDDTLGLCAFHRGTSKERWGGLQLGSWRVGTAAIADAYGIDPARYLIGHKEWTSRKIDPYGLHMPTERHTVTTIIEEAHTMAGTTSNPAFQDAYDKAVAAGVFSEHTDPSDPVTAEKLAVFLDRAGVLDPESPAGEHTHRASIRLQ